jgi:glycosyltransferase involved in cell wall biosynthesis
MTDPLKVALVQYRDARDVRNWSGTLHFSKGAVDRHVGPVIDLSPAPVNFFPFRVARKLVQVATGKIYSYDHEPALARYYGQYFSRRVAQAKPELIFSPSGSSGIAYLETEVPMVYFTDGPWSVIKDYYPTYTNVVRRTDRTAEELERRSLERAAVVLVSSEWAAESVVRDYGIDPAKVHNVFIGANLPHPPAREEVLPRKLGEKLRLLMVGVLWDIKGGDIAYAALLELLKLGYDAELTVVGCTPPTGTSHPRMRVIPFLNKQLPEERARFERLWREADFFILPSRAEAAGVVFCEASAHGVPSIATHTGGIPSLVVNGRNGYTIPHEAGGAEYARVIAELADDPERYVRLCESSRDEFETRLNWDAWGTQVARIIGDTFPEFRDRLPAPDRARAALDCASGRR